ncbi:MAG: CotH kinase family protein, partial [Bacteroidales bacterium]|nr:CotH kinase family protein [Bacteroidales bacterium]
SVRVEFPFQNCSYGRYPDGSVTWKLYKQHSQGGSNSETFINWKAPEPEFSHKAGRYSIAFSLTLTAPGSGYTIRYTTDGSEPVESSPSYSYPVSVNKTTTVKARCFAPGLSPGNVVANTYFIKEHTFNLPVISLSLDSKYLWDNAIGIYTNGTNGITGNCSDSPMNWNRNWERYAHVEYFLRDGTRIINTGAGLKIAGGCSRGFEQKSFGVYFRDKYGADNVRYPLFRSKQADRFKALMLRNSGNDFNRTMIQDALMQTLLIGEMDIDYNAYTPSVVYLNGEYWGIMNTREKINEAYFITNYGLDEDSIDFLENNQSVLAGSAADYNALNNYITNNDLSVTAHYQYVKDRIDIDEYMNYQIAQIYVGNTDWPGNNVKFWKPKKTGGKWRWIIYDTDFGFGLYDNADHNTLTFALETNGPGWPNPPWSTLLFRKLLQNEEFKNQFIDRFSIYIYSIFNPARVNKIIDSLKLDISEEIPYHFNRWGGNTTNWTNNINVARNYAEQRPAYMMSYLQDYFGLTAPHGLKIQTNHHQYPFVSLNDVVINDTVYNGQYFGDRTIKIRALPDKNYSFKQWKLRYSDTETITFITSNSEWHYLDDNTQPDATWTAQGFDDSGWKTGNGQLGYGDGDETTTLDYGGDENNKTITYYFRKKFTVSDPTGLNNLTINLLLDDGAVIYLNGTEITRYNMPAGTINHGTFATSYIEDENVYHAIVIPDIVLSEGENVIAVELHQCSLTSSDIGFDLNASATRLLGTSEETNSNTELTMTLSSDLELFAEFEKNDVINNLYINEICTKNNIFPDDEYEYDDWIELYNSGDDTLNLAGLYLTNNLSLPTLFRISGNVPAMTQMPPDSYLVLWADGQSEQGVLHLDFKLAKDGGQVGLAHSTANGIYYIDSLRYPEQKTDYSYGRYADGTDRWFLLAGMTPGHPNIYTEIAETENLSLTVLYPNPVNNILNIAFGAPLEKPATLIIYSVPGHEIIHKTIETGTILESIDVSWLDKGIYFITISHEQSTFTTKILKNY